jgi:transposase
MRLCEIWYERGRPAKKDQLRAKHRLSKFLLRHGRRPPTGVKPWTLKYLTWVKQGVHFEQPAQEATLLDYLHEVEHAQERIARLDLAIEEAVKSTSPKMKAVIEGLQALRGIAQVAAVTIVAELGEISRFSRARRLMGYGGIVASEHSSGESTQRGSITKTGNTHLRRVVVEAAWAYRHRPNIGETLRKRQEGVSEEIREIAWKAQHRLHARYRKLMARGKVKGKVVTAIGRELLGFIWAIGVQAEAVQKKTEQRAA